MTEAHSRGYLTILLCFLGLTFSTMRVAAAQDASTIEELALPRRGDIVFTLRNRAFIIPERVQPGLTIQPTFGISWLVTDAMRLGIDAQTVDNSGPGRQGSYLASRTVPGGGSGNFLQEITLETSIRVRANETRSNWLSVNGTVSRARRSYFATDTFTGRQFGGNRSEIVPTLTMEAGHRDSRFGVAGSLVSAFLPKRNAMYVRALPDETRRFGTVLGAQLAADVQLAGPLAVWGRGFVPLTGHNTIDRGSGRPDRATAYDAGVRLRLNPALDIELFSSNALGNTGALSFIPDREYHAVAMGLRMRPGERFASAPLPVADRFDDEDEVPPTGLALASLAPTTMRQGKLNARVRGGGQGVLGAVEISPVRSLQLGAFIDFLSGTKDEGELGATARVTLVEENSATPLRVGVLVAASRTNNPLVNLIAGRWDEINRLGLPKGGFSFGDEDLEEGRVYVVAGALSVEKRLNVRSAIRAAPVVGYVQRHGVQLTGVAAGFEQTLSPALSLALESGFTAGKGNELTARGRKHAVPYAVIVGWRPGTSSRVSSIAPLTLDAYVTNRAGDSPFHMLRVRAGGGITGGVGLRMTVP